MTYVFFLYFLVFLVCFLFYVKLLWLYQSPTLLLLSVLLLVVVGFFCCCWFVCLVHFSLHGLSFCPFALELQVEFFSNSEMSRINSRTLICFLYQISDSWKCELNLLTFMWMSYICILSLFSLCCSLPSVELIKPFRVPSFFLYIDLEIIPSIHMFLAVTLGLSPHTLNLRFVNKVWR